MGRSWGTRHPAHPERSFARRSGERAVGCAAFAASLTLLMTPAWAVAAGAGSFLLLCGVDGLRDAWSSRRLSGGVGRRTQPRVPRLLDRERTLHALLSLNALSEDASPPAEAAAPEPPPSASKPVSPA